MRPASPRIPNVALPEIPPLAPLPADSLDEHALIDRRLVPVREVRIAVTMAGGVSLAIYESGVAQELFRMVHGQGIYGLLKRITQSHAYIDVLSGTSAGGINTICLATALATGSDLRPLRETWIQLAGIDDLLQDPRDLRVTSLFKGNDYFLDLLQKEFFRLAHAGKAPEWPRPGVPSGGAGTLDCTDLDLFVTGTYFEGQPRAFFDTRNCPIFTHDHNGVFHLRHRPRRRESHFDPRMSDPSHSDEAGDDPGPNGVPWPAAKVGRPERFAGVQHRLAQIARTTASLPAVFEPSEVRPELMNGVIELPRGRTVNYIMDGGFLNNRPLDHVLNEIYRRPASQEVLRKVFFVEPQAESLRQPAQGEPRRPNALENLWFYKDVPGRQSLSNCLADLFQHNQRVRRVGDTLKAVRQLLAMPLRGEQRNLWVEIALLEQRDQLIQIWRKALGLEGYGGLQRGSDLGEAGEARRRLQAQSLQILQDLIHRRMVKCCIDFTTAPRTEFPFRLEEIDTTTLDRQTMRAIDEVYRRLYPPPEPLDPAHARDAQSVRQECLQRLRKAGHLEGKVREEAVQICLTELNHLRSLVEIVDENLAMTVAALVETDTFRQASQAALALAEADLADASDIQELTLDRSQELDKEVDQLWRLIVRVLRELLRHDERLAVEPDRRKQDWMRDEAERVRALMTKRSNEACLVLRGQEDEHKGRRKAWSAPATAAVAGAAPPPPLVTVQLCLRLNTIVHEAARLLQPAVDPGQDRPVDIAIDCPVSQTSQPSVPLSWAYKQGESEDLPWIQHEDALRTVAAVESADHIGERLRRLDMLLLPIERAADLPSRSPVELVHVSPRDVQLGLSDEAPENKLAGDVLMNLGAFLKRSWRANDQLWGRMDGAGVIVDTLLEHDRVARLLRAAADAGETQLPSLLQAAIERYLLRGEATPVSSGPSAREDRDRPDGLVPDRAAAAAMADPIGHLLLDDYWRLRERIQQWLTDGYNRTRSRPGEANALSPLRDLLLRRHQLEILIQEEELSRALAAAMAEHAQWQGRADAPSLRFRAREGAAVEDDLSEESERRRDDRDVRGLLREIEEETTALAEAVGFSSDDATRGVIGRLAQQRVRALFVGSDTASAAARMRDYFERQYAIGREAVASHIPPLVTLRRVLGLALVALHVLSNALSPEFRQTRLGGLLLRAVLTPLSFVTGALYGFVSVMAQGRAAAAALHALAWSAVLLGLGAYFFGMITSQVAPLVLSGVVGVLVVEGVVAWCRPDAGALARVTWLVGTVLLLFVSAVQLKYFKTSWPWPSALVYLWWVGCALLIASPAFALLSDRSVPGRAILLAGALLFLAALGLGWYGDRSSLSAVSAFAGWIEGHVPFGWWVVGAVLLLSVLAHFGKSLTNREAPLGMVSYQLAGSGRRAGRILRSWSISGWKQARRSLLLDYLFLAIYSTLFALLCVQAVKPASTPILLATGWAGAGLALALGQWLAGLLDAAENTLLLLTMQDYQVEGRSRFRKSNILDPEGLLERLRSPRLSDVTSKHVSERLSAKNSGWLTAVQAAGSKPWRRKDRKTRLADALNSLLLDQLLDVPDRFREVVLSPRVERLRQKWAEIPDEEKKRLQSPQRRLGRTQAGRVLTELNRLLLEDAYSEELSRRLDDVKPAAARWCALAKFALVAAGLLFLALSATEAAWQGLVQASSRAKPA